MQQNQLLFIENKGPQVISIFQRPLAAERKTDTRIDEFDNYRSTALLGNSFCLLFRLNNDGFGVYSYFATP
jgi:hypothetical protein